MTATHDPHRDRPMSIPTTRRPTLSSRAGAALLAAATLAAAGSAGSSDAREPAKPPAAAPPARGPLLDAQGVAEVREALIGSAVTLGGPLQPKETVTLREQVPGTIADLRADRGTRVRRGQRTATIRAAGVVSQAAGARAGVAAAQANVTVAQKQMEAARELHGAGAMTQIERQSAEASHEAAVAQLAAARAQATSAGEAAGFTAVTAPLDGVVSARQRQEGEAVNPGDELLTVVDGRVLELSGQIGVADAARVKVGQPVTFALDAFPGEEFRGRVARVDPVADAGTRQVGVYVELANASGRIIGGQYARGRIALGAARALVVPATAVRSAAADGAGA
ncbi:efflux RND transporter periplasmic adaptor subunit, partial [Roseisolibacter sp. H3M3-2]|uniref:efflux RND transporter periplasmic adaptor subunit n=1 Tax=Roseisolibacter sp. H3M3-2 TaxID=3031323 RepID=UPI0023DCABC6